MYFMLKSKTFYRVFRWHRRRYWIINKLLSFISALFSIEAESNVLYNYNKLQFSFFFLNLK